MQKKTVSRKRKIVFSKDFLDFFKILNKHKTEYLLIGGYAVSFYGYPRFTGDIDIRVNNDLKNAKKVLKSLTEFGVPVKNISIEDLTSKKPMNGLFFGIEPYRIDIITALDKLKFNKSYKSSKKRKINGITIKIISKEDLIKNKKYTGRLQDLADIEQITINQSIIQSTNN